MKTNKIRLTSKHSSFRLLPIAVGSCRLLPIFLLVAFSLPPLTGLASEVDQRPNIIIMIAEDMSMKDWGPYGNTYAKTPNIDAVARQGVTFTSAFCNSPVCHSARSVLLTGQEIWRLRDAAVFGGTLHNDIPTYVDLLKGSGYDTAYSGKGWGPGALAPGGRTSPPTGKEARLADVLHQDGKRPFCFWWGSALGHRPFEYRPDGRSPAEIELPPYIPDTPAVREDYAGYYQEVETFDAEVGNVVQQLEAAGVTDNTMLIITSDHGMPWPRGKGSLYDLGTRVPLIVRWPTRVKPGRVVDDFVDLTDFAPTFLDAGGVKTPAEMTGESLIEILESQKTATIDPNRDRTFLGLEAHPDFPGWLGYMSCRAVRTEAFLYIRNYRRDGHTGWKPLQAGPIVSFMQNRMTTDKVVKHNYELCFGLRPSEELYDVKADPHQIKNLANDPNYADTKQKLRAALTAYQQTTNDPRATGDGGIFKHYPVWCDGGKMGGHTRSGKLEIFPEANYGEWIKKNLK